MPIYEFQCTKCRHLFEEFHTKVVDRPSAKCPDCGAKAKKIISNVGIVFKGSGFYVTDSRTGSSSDSKAATKTETKTETSTETKAETKSEPKSEPKKDSKKKSDSD